MRNLILLSLALPLVIQAQEPPVVIATLGQTVDARHYVGVERTHFSVPAHPDAIKLSNLKSFSVRSMRLTPGPVKTRKVHSELPFTPLFLVGIDPTSIAWLKQYSSKLKRLNARGYLVSVKNKHDYDYFVTQTGWHLPPISGDSIAKAYSISHYPVLVSDKLIEQ